MRKKTLYLIAIILVFVTCYVYREQIFYQGPIQKITSTLIQPISVLSFTDLENLKESILDDNLKAKLNKQLTTPYVVNSIASGVKNFKLNRNYIRIAHWNIATGGKVSVIRNFFLNPDGFYGRHQNNLKKEERRKFKKEIHHFRNADVICLNEVDIGMPRTQYKNITKELARILGYNYAFATEFVELGPLVHNVKVDRFRYLGLHGNAIVSRFPIKSVKIIRLPECYDWFNEELKKRTPLEQVRRAGAKGVFEETIVTEVRRGNRCALVAELELPGGEIITVVSTHFEDRCFPSCRLKQMKHLLSNLQNVKGPLVLGGDFNTSTTDTAPTSLKKELVKRLRDPHFLARQAVVAVTPGIPIINNLIAAVVSKTLQYKDPTVPSIPIFFPNHERELFNYLKEFRFADGRGFDFEGDKELSADGKSGFLSNSNERQLKGFESTFEFEEQRVIGYFKLDWFFVKPTWKSFRPFNGQTLKTINDAYPGRISDHNPITVDISI